MKIYMSNIEHINNTADLEKKLSESELTQYNKFNDEIRKLQYLVGHAMVMDVCKENVKIAENGAPTINNGFISIAHKDNWVIVAVSDMKTGIDIENTTVERDFSELSRILKLPGVHTKQDFYKEFVRYESKIKFNGDIQGAHQYFYQMNKYIICIISADKNIQFFNYDKSFSDAGALVNFMCAE